MTDDAALDAEELLISVYIDTSALFDLLATIEDGFTLVERVPRARAPRPAAKGLRPARFRVRES
jgi:hypothetical protein